MITLFKSSIFFAPVAVFYFKSLKISTTYKYIESYKNKNMN